MLVLQKINFDGGIVQDFDWKGLKVIIFYELWYLLETVKPLIVHSFQTPVVPTLDKVLEAQPEKREAILDEMKQILTPMAQK